MIKHCITVIICIILTGFSSKAQDTIIFRTGNVIVGNVVKIVVSDSAQKIINYKILYESGGVSNSLSSDNVLAIKYKNGQEEIFDSMSYNLYLLNNSTNGKSNLNINGNAADTIILREGNIFVCRVMKIKVSDNGEKKIKYKLLSDLGGASYSLESNKVAGIKYQNGQLEIFDSQSFNKYISNLNKMRALRNDSINKIYEKPKLNIDSIYIAKIEKLQEDLKKQKETQRIQDSLNKDSIYKSQIKLQKQKEEKEINDNKLKESQRIQDSLNSTLKDKFTIDLQKQKKNEYDKKNSDIQKIQDSLSKVSNSNSQKEFQKQKEEYDKKIDATQKKQDSLNQVLAMKEQEISNAQITSNNKIYQNENRIKQLLDSIANIKNKSTEENQSSHKEVLRKPKTFGIGLNFLTIPTIAGNSILLPITLMKNIRIETEFYEKGGGSNFLAFSFYGMYQKGKTNIYLGPRIVFNDLDKHIKSDSTKARFWYPINIGAEYLFAEQFSIGGEVFFYSSWTAKLNRDSSSSNSGWDSFTGSRLILRFYF